MGDLFLHVPFARRLRFAEGLHPLAREALVRKSPQLALGAALPELPIASTNTGSFFSRLFKLGRGEAQKWQQLLSPTSEPRAELILQMLLGGGSGAGPLHRLSLGLGVLSHELLAVELNPIYEGLDGPTRHAVQRGQARLWLQFSVSSRRDLETEWAPALAFHELESHRRCLTHVDDALKAALGDAPGRDAVGKWARSLFTEVTPLMENGGVPQPGSLADHAVKARYFDGDSNFLDHIQNVTTRFVFLAGRVAACFLGDEPDIDTLRGALTTDDGLLREAPGSDDLAADQTRWKSSIADHRAETLTRGRNLKAAFEGEGLLEGLPDLPPLPAEEDDGGQAPAVTQEVSLAQIEAEMGGHPAAAVVASPTSTQQISAADIEDELQEQEEEEGAPAPPPEFTPSPEITPPPPPTSTQQISASDIEAELASNAPPPPTSTQQISAADIEAELAANLPPPPPAELPPFPAPAHTQQISVLDIEAEVSAEAAGGPPTVPPATDPPAPSHAQSHDQALAGEGMSDELPASSPVDQNRAEQPEPALTAPAGLPPVPASDGGADGAEDGQPAQDGVQQGADEP